MNLTVLQHPLAAHFLTHLRDKTTTPDVFRVLTRRLTALLVIEATRDLAVQQATVETPLETCAGYLLADQVVAVPVLRAGLGMLDAVTELIPNISVGYIGLERNPDTAVARSYYAKLPTPMDGRTAIVLDPMLATGGTADHAIRIIKTAGAQRVIMVCVVAAPEGVERLTTAHPDVQIITAAWDRELNARKYICPGLGDFGDRLYGTEQAH